MIMNGPWSWGGYNVPAEEHGCAAPCNPRPAVGATDDLSQGLFDQRQCCGGEAAGGLRGPRFP